jgi:hypothetical protein
MNGIYSWRASAVHEIDRIKEAIVINRVNRERKPRRASSCGTRERDTVAPIIQYLKTIPVRIIWDLLYFNFPTIES